MDAIYHNPAKTKGGGMAFWPLTLPRYASVARNHLLSHWAISSQCKFAQVDLTFVMPSVDSVSRAFI